MNTPQEAEVWVLIPAIRRQFALELKTYGLKHKDIAGLLHVTVPAISQYMNSKRAKDVVFTKPVLDEIKRSAKQIHRGKADSASQLQRIIKVARQDKLVCKICNEHCGTAPGCKRCY